MSFSIQKALREGSSSECCQGICLPALFTQNMYCFQLDFSVLLWVIWKRDGDDGYHHGFVTKNPCNRECLYTLWLSFFSADRALSCRQVPQTQDNTVDPRDFTRRRIQLLYIEFVLYITYFVILAFHILILLVIRDTYKGFKFIKD